MNGMQDLLSSDEFTEVRQCLALAHRSRDRDPATIQGVSLACALLAVSWLSICVLDPDPGRCIAETVGIGYFFGSMFAHATLAAAWNAFGPGLWSGDFLSRCYGYRCWAWGSGSTLA